MSDLIDLLLHDAVEHLAPGAVVLRGFAAGSAEALLAQVEAIAAAAPFRHLITPGGHRMSVAMTCCGDVGWVSDTRGYRYEAADPTTGRAWPRLPARFLDLADSAARAGGFLGFAPDTCLINSYAPGARLTLHQDRDERAMAQPIVSVSLGLPATFLWGGKLRADRARRVRVAHGDVVVWGGPARDTFHGVAPLAAGAHDLCGLRRINLTFRRARPQSPPAAFASAAPGQPPGPGTTGGSDRSPLV